MTQSLLKRVKSKLFIPSQRRSLHILEGEYRSLAFGRSTDFEDLREYEPGDDIKDIDWKATARTSVPLVRRYIAARRHTVMLVADTGRNMQAVSASLEPKYELATLALGVMGYLAVRHTDSVTALYGDSNGTLTIPAKSTDSHLERVLQAVQSHSTQADNAPSDISVQLRHIISHYSQRMILVIVADNFDMSEDNLALLRLLQVKHDIMWISVADADPLATLPSKDVSFDILDWYEIPDFIKKEKELIADFAESEIQRRHEMKLALDGLRIPHIELTDSDSALGKLISLLERRRKQNG